MSETITLTFGNCAENHKDMQIIGTPMKDGLTLDHLNKVKEYYESKGKIVELIDLTSIAPLESKLEIDPAYILIVRKALNEAEANTLYDEQKPLKKDSKAFMYGRVVNKKARHNLCFSDFSQEPDYENKKGTVYDFKDLPRLRTLRESLHTLIDPKFTPLQCEGNYYYDVSKTYIGEHGDTERSLVIALRLGADFPLYYRWFHKSEPVSKHLKIMLSHGDMYFMSEKAVGSDWKCSSKYTLRHCAGFEENLKF